MTNYVGPDGPTTAKLAIVAEKPSHDEIAIGKPLVGPTGQMLMRILARVGLKRSDVYLTNAVKHVDFVGNPTDSDLRREQPALFRELASLPNLNCIVALGQSSLVALSNFAYNDITARRGSVLQSFIRKKMVPTFHTSYIVRGNWEMEPVVTFDLARAKKQSEFPEIRRTERHFNIMPTFDEALDWLHHLESGEWLSFDLETRRAGPHMNWYITHFGASNDPLEGFCIPLAYQDRRPYWTPQQECQIWRAIQHLLELPHKRYVTQNGLNADCWWLYRHGIHTPYMSRGFDTMLGHRYLAADLPHALDFLVSIYTEEEYYKDESGKHEDDARRVTDEQYQIYNCKDAAVTLAVAWAEIEDMKELDLYDYYMAEKQSQWDVLFEMRKIGFHVDKAKKAILTTKLERVVQEHARQLNSTLGWVPNTKSPIDMARVLERFDIRPTITPKTKKAKISEERLLAYAHQKPESRPTITSCLEITSQRTLLGSFLRLTTDPLDFYHATYDLSKAKTGRLSSEGADEGHLLPPKKKAGPQLMNVPRSLRGMFKTDGDNCCDVAHFDAGDLPHSRWSHWPPITVDYDELTSFDFTQAEPHVVAWLAQDLFYINALLSGKDVHRIAGTVIFRGYDTSSGVLPPDDLITSIPKFCDKCLASGEPECTHSERYLSKRCKNGFAYRMGVERLMTVLRGDNIFITKPQAELIKSRVLTLPLVAWWESVRRDLQTNRWLTNIYGTKKEFYGLLDDKTLGEALSWLAQSAVTHLTCRAMRLLDSQFKRDGVQARVVTQTHDSIVINHNKTLRPYIHRVIESVTTYPTMVHGRELNIPKEITHGPTWSDQEKCQC